MESNGLITKIRKIAIEEVIVILMVWIPLGWWGYSQIGQRFDRSEKEYFRQFENIDKQFDRIEKSIDSGLDKICNSIDVIARDNRDYHGRLSKLEGINKCLSKQNKEN